MGAQHILPILRSLDAGTLDSLLDFPALVQALAEAFRGGISVPVRHHHTIAGTGKIAGATHLLMPAWTNNAPAPSAYLGTKIVNVFPSNGDLGLPAVLGLYLLQSGETGAPLAVMDGTRLTHWRTAAVAALGASLLAREDSSHLLMVGAGALAPFLVRAHMSVRPIRKITFWNHRHSGAEKLCNDLKGLVPDMQVADTLEAAVRQADIISCATLSSDPLVKGTWLQSGSHLDLVGAFSLSMREADDEALRRAQLFIDTEAARTEGGDVALALRNGAISADHIVGDLAGLCAGSVIGRETASDITVFKAVGTALGDLATAMLAWREYGRRQALPE